MSTLDKKTIRDFGISLGADVVGFAAIEDYQSPRSPNPKKMLPGVRSIVVMGFREAQGAVESDYPRVGNMCRLGTTEVSRTTAWRVARLIEKETRTKALPIPMSNPLEMSVETQGMIADVSMRHAAVAAGLGVFGRHNLVINPELGSPVIYTAVLSEIPFTSDPKVAAELCDQCGLCASVCPAKALEVEGKTDINRCLRTCRPLGVGAVIGYFSKMVGKPPEEQIKMLRDPQLWNLYQALEYGTYACFKCVAVCPVGR